MKIVHIAQLHPDIVTGPRVSIPHLSAQLNGISGIESRIYSTFYPYKTQILGQEILPHTALEVSPQQVAVFSGIYDHRYISLAHKMNSIGMPYVISPRSSLMVSSLRKSPIRKAAFLGVVGRSFLTKRRALHYLSEAERANSLFRDSRHFIAGNGLAHWPASVAPEGKERLITYIGRYDIRHKGLDLLIGALNIVQAALRRQHWRVVLRGSDQAGGRKEIDKVVRDCGLTDLIDVGDAVWGEEKYSLLEKSSVFIHTSRYEGQPQSVMEAMAFGCAIIATPGVNLPEIQREGAGWESQPTANGIASTIGTAISSRDLSNYGMQARQIALSKFSWDASAASFLAGLNAVGLL